MKITYNSLINSVSNSVQTNLRKLQGLQQMLSSGKNVNAPSDDPIKTARLNILGTKKSQHIQFIKTIDQATGWLEFTENSLDQINSTMQDIRDMIIQAGNGALDEEGRNSIILSLDQSKENLINYANSQYLGNYVFAGLNTTEKPFVEDAVPGGISYTGDDSSMAREISFGSQMEININGARLFNMGNAVSADHNIFELIDDLREALIDGDLEEISGDILNKVDNACKNIGNIYSEIGSKINRLNMSKQQHENIILDLSKTISTNEDIDIAEVIMELKKAEMVYNTSLSVAGRIFPPSLLDYLK
jgi:flagellar hook-associated protein 3 FlgL